MGTEKESMAELTERIGRKTGGLSASPFVSSIKSSPEPVSYLMVRAALCVLRWACFAGRAVLGMMRVLCSGLARAALHAARASLCDCTCCGGRAAWACCTCFALGARGPGHALLWGRQRWPRPCFVVRTSARRAARRRVLAALEQPGSAAPPPASGQAPTCCARAVRCVCCTLRAAPRMLCHAQ